MINSTQHAVAITGVTADRDQSGSMIAVTYQSRSPFEGNGDVKPRITDRDYYEINGQRVIRLGEYTKLLTQDPSRSLVHWVKVSRDLKDPVKGWTAAEAASGVLFERRESDKQTLTVSEKKAGTLYWVSSSGEYADYTWVVTFTRVADHDRAEVRVRYSDGRISEDCYVLDGQRWLP